MNIRFWTYHFLYIISHFYGIANLCSQPLDGPAKHFTLSQCIHVSTNFSELILYGSHRPKPLQCSHETEGFYKQVYIKLPYKFEGANWWVFLMNLISWRLIATYLKNNNNKIKRIAELISGNIFFLFALWSFFFFDFLFSFQLIACLLIIKDEFRQVVKGAF